MHWTTHIITGAAVGYCIGHSGPAALAGVLSHLVADMVPHHDPDSDIGYVVDSALGAVCLLALAKSETLRRLDPGEAALWGAAGAAMPDLELLVKLVKDVDSDRYIFPAHNGRLPHREAAPLLSTAVQVVVAGGCLGLAALRWRLRRAAGAGGPGG